MSDSKPPHTPGPSGQGGPSPRPDLFAARSDGTKPSPRLEDSVRILSTVKPAPSNSVVNSARRVWISGAAVACLLAVAVWYASTSRSDATPPAVMANASPAAASAVTPAASLAVSAPTVVVDAGLPASDVVASTDPSDSSAGLPAQASPEAAAAELSGVSSAAAAALAAAVVAAADKSVVAPSAAKASGTRTMRTAAAQQAGRDKTVASKKSSTKTAKAAQAKREQGARLASAKKRNDAKLAATPAAVKTAAMEPLPRDAEVDVNVVEALLPYVKRSPPPTNRAAASRLTTNGSAANDCASLAGADAAACPAHLCAGRRGQDPACPAPSTTTR